MNRKEFWIRFAKENGISQEKSKRLCKAFFKLLAEAIQTEDRVVIADFGVFKKKKLKPHRIKEVNSGLHMEIPEKTKIVFEPSAGIMMDE